MFNKKYLEHKKPGTNIFYVLLRSILSITMMFILVIGIYQAYIFFTGVDPLKINPQNLIGEVLSSEQPLDALTAILGVDLSGVKQGLPKDLLNKVSKTDIANLAFRFAIVSDSHNDNERLSQALLQAKSQGVVFVIGLGDYSSVGTVEELQKAKATFQAANLPYYVTAGDHDLWEPRNRGSNPAGNFVSVFGPAYQSFGYEGIRFIIVYNSDNYEGVDGLQMSWLDDELTKVAIEKPKAVFLFLHEPLYHPSSDHVVGKINLALKDQAEKISAKARQADIKEVFAGDTHFYTRYTDPKSLVDMTAVGAVTKERNTQKSRFMIVDVYDSGEYSVQDLEIK